MSKFALIGAAGYIAPRHMKAIQDTGNELVAAMDISDSVGVLDSYFPQAQFFTEFERFERHLEKLRRNGEGIDFLTVCTPNYLHDSHTRCGIRLGANVICEKPVVIKPKNLVALSDLAKHWNKKIYSITQMRLHPVVKQIREMMARKAGIRGYTHYVEIKYAAPRGDWYTYSWKSDEKKSGGLIYNLGIHLLDLVIFLFGPLFEGHTVKWLSPHTVEGEVYLSKARIKWFLSTIGQAKKLMVVDGEEYDLSSGFEDLHTKCYESILSGDDLFDMNSSYNAIKLADELHTNMGKELR